MMCCSLLLGCHPAAPQSAADVADEHRTTTDHAAGQEGEAESVSSPSTSATEAAAATIIVDELTAVVSAALGGHDLPTTMVRLSGSRGEQVVAVVGGGFPEGALDVEASMLKVDITLDGCGERDGLTLGLFQTRQDVYIVGLGDQFSASSGPSAVGHEDVATLTNAMLRALSNGSASELVLDHDRCAEILGNAEHCRRMFQELPDDAVLARYGQMLSECEATPLITLSIVALLLRDERGRSFQGMARLAAHEGELSLTEPITIAPGLP